MKPQNKNSKGLYLQKRNNRWKWMAGATAASAAGVTASQANGITINLVDNYISGSGGNHLNADLTGDGHPDLTISGSHASFFTYKRTCGDNCHYTFSAAGATAFLNGVRAGAVFFEDQAFAFVTLGSQHKFANFGTSLTGSIPIFFKDLHINGGAPTKGSLEVTVSARPGAEVQLDSFTYNDPSFHAANATAVPDQGSSLALLAMGAGGVLALRHRRKTANN